MTRLFKRRPNVLRRYQRQYRYILVDEFQDTNRAQSELVALLAERHRNVTVVGDDDQSIYRFRGADVRNILDFRKDYPDAHVVRLEQNYRSSQAILDAAYSVIRSNPERAEKKLWTDREPGAPLRLLLCGETLQRLLPRVPLPRFPTQPPSTPKPDGS